MRTNPNDQTTLQNLLIEAFLDLPDVMHPAESYALAHGLCRHFELDVSPVDILHAIAMAEELIEEYLEETYVVCNDWPTVQDDCIPF